METTDPYVRLNFLKYLIRIIILSSKSILCYYLLNSEPSLQNVGHSFIVTQSAKLKGKHLSVGVLFLIKFNSGAIKY